MIINFHFRKYSLHVRENSDFIIILRLCRHNLSKNNFVRRLEVHTSSLVAPILITFHESGPDSGERGTFTPPKTSKTKKEVGK